jgi:hypothetical protein
MRIDEIYDKVHKKLSGDPTIQPSDHGDDTEYDDVRDIASNAISSFNPSGIKRNSGSSSGHLELDRMSKIKNLGTANQNTKQKVEIFKKFVEEFKDSANIRDKQVSGRSYNEADGSLKGIELGVRTKNNVLIRFALGSAGDRIPSRLRLDLSQSEATENARQEVLSVLTDILSKVPGFPSGAFDYATNGKNAWFDNNGKVPSIKLDDLNLRTSEKLIDIFWKIVDAVDSLGVTFTSTSRGAGSKISTPRTNDNYYLGLASMIYIGNKFGLKELVPRGGKIGKDSMGAFDLYDDKIIVGYTAEGKDAMMRYSDDQKPNDDDRRWREHAVPCDYIVSLAIDMYQKSKSTEYIDQKTIYKVAKMIKRNLFIIVTKQSESAIIDAKFGNSGMPEGWKDGMDPLARFTALGIQVFPIGGGKRLREDNQ